MNDKIIKYRVLSSLSLTVLLLSSCSQEAPTFHGGEADDSDILFYMSLPGVSTRSYDNIEEGNLEGGFSVAAIAPEIPSAGGKKYTVLYPPQLVTRTPGMGDAFRGEGCKWPENSGTKEGTLDFCAFYPSLETMREKAGVEPDNDQYFLVHDVKNNNTYSYRMGNYLINKDISRHADFVGAFAQGSKTNNLYSGVKLEFEHKLCKVDLKAWGNNEGYDIEIAGVRIGGVIVKSTYNMNGNWIHNNLIFDCVDYIYCEGDTIVKIGQNSHDSKSKARSIMGNGGDAMLIPHQPSNLTTNYKGFPKAWDTASNLKNEKTGNYPNLTVNGNNFGMFFSVLLRVIDTKPSDNKEVDNMILYPHEDGAIITGTTTASNKNSVYLVVEKTTEIVKGRVYKDKTTKQYFADNDLKNPYTAPESCEIREYGWAAIPYSAEWYINNQYTYTLNYSEGVGLHAPDDDAPGKAIITPLSVGISEEGGDWEIVKKYEEVLLEEGEDKDFTYTQE